MLGTRAIRHWCYSHSQKYGQAGATRTATPKSGATDGVENRDLSVHLQLEADEQVGLLTCSAW